MGGDISSDGDIAERRRRVRYRAWRRGIREADLLLGPFADAAAAAMSARDLTDFETLLDLPDQTVLDWLVAGEEPPPVSRTPLLARIRAFLAERASHERA